MGSITDIFSDVIEFFVNLVTTGSAAAGGVVEAGSTAANQVLGAVTGSALGADA